MKRYRLLHVHGCVEPQLLPGVAKSWRGLERELVAFLKSNSYKEEDALFFVETDPRGRLLDVSAFSGGYMDEMWTRAGRCPSSIIDRK